MPILNRTWFSFGLFVIPLAPISAIVTWQVLVAF
jgi:hypothetical protein